jgi:hypothetical protein
MDDLSSSLGRWLASPVGGVLGALMVFLLRYLTVMIDRSRSKPIAKKHRRKPKHPAT